MLPLQIRQAEGIPVQSTTRVLVQDVDAFFLDAVDNRVAQRLPVDDERIGRARGRIKEVDDGQLPLQDLKLGQKRILLSAEVDRLEKAPVADDELRLLEDGGARGQICQDGCGRHRRSATLTAHVTALPAIERTVDSLIVMVGVVGHVDS